jgi:hypothetical protein
MMSDQDDQAVLARASETSLALLPVNARERVDFVRMMRDQLRGLSEEAFRAGFENSGSLIEVAALMVEMEGHGEQPDPE